MSYLFFSPRRVSTRLPCLMSLRCCRMLLVSCPMNVGILRERLRATAQFCRNPLVRQNEQLQTCLVQPTLGQTMCSMSMQTLFARKVSFTKGARTRTWPHQRFTKGARTRTRAGKTRFTHTSSMPSLESPMPKYTHAMCIRAISQTSS